MMCPALSQEDSCEQETQIPAFVGLSLGGRGGGGVGEGVGTGQQSRKQTKEF